jgi:hypothetical protein
VGAAVGPEPVAHAECSAEITFVAGEHEQRFFEHREQFGDLLDDQVGDTNERDDCERLGDDPVGDKKGGVVRFRREQSGHERDERSLLEPLVAVGNGDERVAKDVEHPDDPDGDDECSELSSEGRTYGGNQAAEDGHRADAGTGGDNVGAQFLSLGTGAGKDESVMIAELRAEAEFRAVTEPSEENVGLAGDGLDEELPDNRDGLDGQVKQAHHRDRSREDEQGTSATVEQETGVQTRRHREHREQSLDWTSHDEGELREDREPKDAEQTPAGGSDRPRHRPAVCALEDGGETEDDDDGPRQGVGENAHRPPEGGGE